MEKTFDWVPREVVKWTMRKLGVGECYIRPIMIMYRNGNSVIRIDSIIGDKFGVTVGVHKGSAFKSFIIALEAISREYKTSLPLEIVYADDSVIIAEKFERIRHRWCMEKSHGK